MSSIRPPVRAIEPLRRGVSMGTLAVCLSAASRVSTCAAGTVAGWPGTGTVVLGPPPRAGGGTAWGRGWVWGWVWGSAAGVGAPWVWVWVWGCFCASWRCMCGRPKKYCQTISTIADSTMARRVFFWSVMWLSDRPRDARWADAALAVVDECAQARE